MMLWPILIGVGIALAVCAPFMLAGSWLIGQGLTIPGVAVMLAPAVAAGYMAWRDDRKTKRMLARKPQHRFIPEPLLAELEQSPEWWDREFEALVRATTPRDAEYHRGHRLREPSNAALASLLTVLAERGLVTPERVPKTTLPAGPMCLDCRVPVERPPDG